MKRIKKLFQHKFFKNYIILLFSFLLLELIFRLNDRLNLLSFTTLRIFLGLNIVSLIMSIVIQYFPKLVAKIWNCFIVFFFTIYGIAELGFNNYLGVYASLQIKTQASAVKSYILDFIKSFHWQFYFMFIPFILLLIYYLVFDKKIDTLKNGINKKNVLGEFIKVFIIILMSCFYFLTLKLDFMQNKFQTVTSYDLFRKPVNPSLTVNEFGYIGFGILDVKEYFFPGKDVLDLINYDPNGLLGNKENNNYVEHLNINNDNWNEIIDNETNEALNNINKYLILNKTTSTNNYTGMFEGKNLIVIMIESGSNIMLDETYYPNLAKLYKEGWAWNNYYSPRSSCSTGNNEMSGMTSLYTIYNNCTANVYKKNIYNESIFNLFNNKGYLTNSFHDNTDAYYYRTTIHKNMGSKAFYKIQDMNISYKTEYGLWASDEDEIEFYLKNLDETVLGDNNSYSPFMSWITTVTSHMPYTTSSIYYDTYKDLFPSSLPKDIKNYMSKLKVVDNAIGKLLDGLEERGILEDTVIAIYADHYPYGITTSNLEKVLDYDLDVDNTMDQVPFIIYNKGMEAKKFDEYTTYINLTPTIANLFNLDYDSRIYLGEDILSNEYSSIVVFADGSWKNENAYYEASSNKITYYTDISYTDEEIFAINEQISLKLKMSSAIIKNDYFNYLFKELSNFSTSE